MSQTPFRARLEARAAAIDSALCVGLDPHPEDARTPAEAVALCERLIRATAHLAVAFKPNAAFFEAWGAEGVAALRQVVDLVPEGPLVLLDAKRGDIASTAAAYATAAFDALGADAVTVSPYLGADSLAPMTSRPDKGAFVLVRTSNPGGADVQDLTLADGRRVFEAVADLVARVDAHGNVGVVVGATRPDELAAVRARLPEAWILAPGVGAQGGDLAAAVAAGARADGRGLLINASRALSRAADPAAAAAALVAEERAARAARRRAPDPLRERVADGLLRVGCVRLGRFTLKSGLTSPIYLDLRRLAGDPGLLADVAALLARVARGLPADVVAALPYAAMPIGTAYSLATGLPMVYPRKEVKEYGTKASVEGVFEAGQVALVVDDLATTGLSKVEGIERLSAAGLVVRDILVVVDRQSGAAEAMAAAGCRLHAAFTLTELLDRWASTGAVTAGQVDEVRAFLAATGPG